MTRSQELALKLKALADTYRTEIWNVSPKLVEQIYFTIGYLEGSADGVFRSGFSELTDRRPVRSEYQKSLEEKDV